MKKFIMALLALVCVTGIGYAIYQNQGSALAGKTEHYACYESEIKQVLSSFNINSAACSNEEKKILEDLTAGKIQVAYGELFSDVEYKDVIKSDVYKTCSFGLYYKKKDNKVKVATAFKNIGYVSDLGVTALKTRYKKATLKKYESTAKLLQDVNSGAIDGAFLSDVVVPKNQEFTFLVFPEIKKNLVFLINKDSKIDIKAFNNKIKEVKEVKKS